jgi:hypothetical protein
LHLGCGVSVDFQTGVHGTPHQGGPLPVYLTVYLQLPKGHGSIVLKLRFVFKFCDGGGPWDASPCSFAPVNMSA